jgi:DNA polymerase-3 subunit alpha
MVDDFIQRHIGKKSPRYVAPGMKEVLDSTYGVIVYQEQAMQLAQKLAGYTMAEADSLRKAMGKKNRYEMAQQEHKFIEGAVERGIGRAKAQQIFTLMRQFADYGFPKSHSVAYAYLAFQTAYLKAHFPEHFYAAVLSNEIEDTAKVFKYSREMQASGIKLLPPDVNESDAGFTPSPGAIRYGLSAIKGIGASSVKAIINARETGRFRSLFDFVERVQEAAINRRVMEGLVCAGAFDSLRPETESLCLWRARLCQAIEVALERSARSRRSKAIGQSDLFAGAGIGEGEREEPLPEAQPWTQAELLSGEKKALGFYITGHPLASYASQIARMGAIATAELSSLETGSRVTIGGIIIELQVRKTKRGDSFAILRLEDQTGAVKCVLWPEAFNRSGPLLANDTPASLSGRLEIGEDGHATVIVDKVTPLETVHPEAGTGIVRLPSNGDFERVCQDVMNVIDRHKGESHLMLELDLEDEVRVRVRPRRLFRVQRGPELETALMNLGCRIEWQ